MNLDPDHLKAFKATVELGTLDAAAKALHVTPSAISQRLKALETQVGRILFERSRPIVATESGGALLRLARQIEQLSMDTALALGTSEARLGISVVINGDSLATWALPAVAEASKHFAIEVVRENEDHSIGLLREGRVMAAISTTSQAVQGCSSAYLGEMRYRPMAAPTFFDDYFASGVDSASFAQAPVVLFDRKDGLQDSYLARRWRRNLDPPRNYIPSSREYTEAVVLGVGWGLIPEPEASELSASGDLVDLDPGEYQAVKLYWHQWRLSSPPLDHLATVVKSRATTRLY